MLVCNFTSVGALEILLPILSTFGKGSTPSFLPLIQSSKVVVELLAFHTMGRLDHGSMLGLKLYQHYTHNRSHNFFFTTCWVCRLWLVQHRFHWNFHWHHFYYRSIIIRGGNFYPYPWTRSEEVVEAVEVWSEEGREESA